MPYLHLHTFPEVLASKTALANAQGEMFAGPDRKALGETHIWKAWQKDTQQAARKAPGIVPPHVMAYFQDTKHLSRPPQPGDTGLDTKKPLEVVEEKPLFGVSYTGITTFEQCPLRWAADKDFKELPYVETEQQKWGNRVHLAMENFLKGKATAEDMKILTDNDWKKYTEAMLKAGGNLSVEREMCLTKGLNPCGWKDWDRCWFRLKGDVLIEKDQTLKYFDWKTGKRKEDDFQIEVTWAIASIYYPEVETFDGRLIFLKDPKPIHALEKPLTRDDLPRIWERILSITNRMEEAWKSKNYRMQSSGLCKDYCGYTKCPHCGKGR